MPRLSGVKERRHQPLFDTLVRSNIATTVQQTSSLFGNANVGQPALTNINAPGQLASDQTYVVLAMRCKLFFTDNATFGTARTLYTGVANQLYFSFILGEKPQFSCPAWYLPAGGGVWAGGGSQGVVTLGAAASVGGVDASVGNFNNGKPTQTAIMKLARPIMVPVRQSIAVQAQFNDITSTTSILTTLNAHAGSASTNVGLKLISFWLDGLQTREVL